MAMEGKGPVVLGSMKLGFDTLVGFAGFAFAVASMLGLFVVAPELAASEDIALHLRLVTAAAAALGFLLIYLFAYPIAKSGCVPLLVVAALGFVALCVSLLAWPTSAELLYGLWAVAAFGFSALSTLWFCFLSAQHHRLVLPFAAAGVGTGIVLCLVESFLIFRAVCVVLVLTWVLSFACLFAVRHSNGGTLPVNLVNSKESDKRSKILWTSAIMLMINNFAFGFVLGIAPSDQTRAFCLGAAAIVALALSIDFTRRRVVTERSISPLTPPLTTLAFLATFLYGDVVQTISLCLLSMLFAVYTIFGLSAVAEHVRISKLSQPRAFGRARLLDNLGILVGIACGFGMARIAATDTLLAVQLSAGIAMAYCFIASFCHKARFPEADMVDGEGRMAPPEAKGLWKKRCRVVSEQCGLSERQFEVLMLVSQGRNAKYIEQALTISLSTAQTHIRNIYRKTGVHSRQELLNLIEETKLYGEE